MEPTLESQSERDSQNSESISAEKTERMERRKGQLGDPEYEVRQFMKNYAQAVREGNLDEILSFFADDVEAFECPPPLAFHGIREYGKNWQSHYVSDINFPTTYDFVDERVFASETLASFSTLLHVRGVSKKTGEDIESWYRLTCVLEKSHGYWQIVHDHMSVPVSEEGQALMNLSPDEIQAH